MKPIELVQSIKKQNTQVLEAVSDKQAAGIIRAAFAQLGIQLRTADEGVLKVPGLGNFRIRQVEKEGQKVSVRKVAFNLTKAKAKRAKKATSAAAAAAQ